MRRLFFEALLACVVACGDDLPSDGAGETPDAAAPADGGGGAVETSVVDGGSIDADADAPITFCTTKEGFIACEDFELGLPPARGFVAPTMGGVVITDDAMDPDGGHAGRAVVDAVDAASQQRWARLATDLVPGRTSYHLELVAKVERDDGGSGDVTVAALFVGDSPSNSVKVVAQTFGTLIDFCTNGGCVNANLAEDFTSWTPVSIDIQAAGAMSVTVGAHSSNNAGTDVGAVTQGTAWVGMVFTGTGGRRTLLFDDAVISSP